MQERPRARLEQNLVALAPHVEPVERADRRIRLALRIAKGGEIVLADERPRRRVHRLGVEAGLHPPGRAALEGERRAAIDDAIEIVASGRAMARVEIGVHALGAENRHGMRMDERIEPLAQAERLPVALEVDMRDLAQSMHASVRAPRAMGGRARAGHRGERALQNFLDREAVLLSLPADERRRRHIRA